MRKKVCLVAASIFTVEVFMLDHIARLSELYDVTLMVNAHEPDYFSKRGINARIEFAPIERKIRPFRDLIALLFLIRAFRKASFDLVHSTTPKAGLLSMIAAFVTDVPARIHIFTGQVWGTRFGLMHWLLRTTDRVTALLATHVLVDSNTQRDFIVRERIVSARKSRVLAKGSMSGVNVDRFKPDDKSRQKIRDQYGIPRDALVYLYMARLTRDKGALVMAEGYSRFAGSGDDSSHLIVVGPDEEGLRPQMAEICRGCIGRVHFVDYTTVPEEFMAAADVFCLPSFREGFGTVYINAAAAGIPAIGSRIYGTEEAVVDNATGLLHDAGNADELAQKMRTLGGDPGLRVQFGRNGRLRACSDFSEAVVTAALLEFYAEVLREKGR